ncbi:MAG: triose-phosphate isomerase [Chloroflexota bacterium]|nr:triose-phosphate isomerase [Chloroflexota bacterium]
MNANAAPLLVGTNLKMNQTAAETGRFITELADVLLRSFGLYFVIPPFTSLAEAVRARDESGLPVWIGAQNMHWEASGAFTGEISAAMLTALGVDLVLLGHAERRWLFHETDEDLQRKVQAALAAGLRVLLCVGETAGERANAVGLETVGRQLKIALNGVATDRAPLLQVAYEPVWSIGAGGTPAKPEDIAPVAAAIRGLLASQFGDGGGAIPILYGGSVDPTNAGLFLRVPEISGLFVGRAAWTPPGFLAIVDAARDASGRQT